MLKNFTEFAIHAHTIMFTSGLDHDDLRCKEIVRQTRLVLKAIKKERGLKSYKHFPVLSPKIRLREESAKRFTQFQSWWNEHKPLDLIGMRNDENLFANARKKFPELPYRSHSDFKTAMEQLKSHLRPEQQAQLRHILEAVAMLGRVSAV